ncbi:MAG: GGDEF domain-containing protein [Pseudomonadota bacterium]
MDQWNDFPTVAVFTILQLGTLIGLMTLVAFTRHVYSGFRHWLASLWLLALAPATLLLFPEDAPLRDSRLFVSWIPFLAAAVVSHEGIRRFRGRPSVWRFDAGIAGIGFLITLMARALDADYDILIVLLSSAMIIILARAAMAMMRGARPGLRVPYGVFAAGLVLMAFAVLFRALTIYLGSMLDYDQTRQLAELVLFVGGSIGTTIAMAGSILAVGQRQEIEMLDLQRVLKRQATTDSLTGLSNRRHFFEEAESALERAGDHSLILFDVDHFKTVNDAYGHDLGDLVLQRIARLLTEALPEGSTAARLGGEEFVVLLSSTKDSAINFAERVLDQVQKHAKDGILRRSVTLSAGIATVAPGGIDASMRLADRRLYHAKRSGRGRVVADGDGDSLDAPATTVVRSERRQQ